MAHLTGQERARYVARMFKRIAPRYDLLNTIMSGGRHYAWRRMATDLALDRLHGTALDVATGTGDFALELALRPQVTGVIGVDFTREMLPIARRKFDEQRSTRGGAGVRFAVADAHALPFADEQFVCATVGFGVRNFIDVPLALREMRRVVVPGGRVVVLEIVPGARSGLLGRLFRLYFRGVVPWLGALLAGDRDAYTYLPESVQSFTTASDLAALMEQAGLRNIQSRTVALGTVAILVGERGE